MQVASMAGKREIIRNCLAAMLFRDDMLNLKQRVRKRLLRDPTVFATVTRPEPNGLSQRFAHYREGEISRTLRAFA